MDPETKSQLYGGDISDHMSPKVIYKSVEEDNKGISDIYDFYVKNKKTLSDLLRFDPSKNFYDELK